VTSADRVNGGGGLERQVSFNTARVLLGKVGEGASL